MFMSLERHRKIEGKSNTEEEPAETCRPGEYCVSYVRNYKLGSGRSTFIDEVPTLYVF